MPKDNVWFGIALGGDGSMARGTDMAVFFADEMDSSFGDYVSVGKRMPNTDRNDDLKPHPDGAVELDEEAGTVTLFARRALDTSDLEDFVFELDTGFDIGIAYSTDYNYLSEYTPHRFKQQFKNVMLKSDGTPMFVQTKSSNTKTET